MKCGSCGLEGHNQRTCPTLKTVKSEPRDRTLIFRVDGMTRDEQNNMHAELVKIKKKITSDEAKATLVEGSSKELPSRIRALIENKTDDV